MTLTAKFKTVIFTLILIHGASAACTVIIVGSRASTDGSTIASQTADGMFDSNITVVPGREFPAGATADVFWGITGQSPRPPKKIGRIPQARQTHAYFHVGYPFMNEHQLVLAESTISQHAGMKTSPGKNAIMTIEQLQVFALQRTKTAREAIKLMGSLAEKYGFLGSYELNGESLAVADGKECWLFEVFSVGRAWDPKSGKSGAVWAAQRIPDDHVFCMANISRIREIDLTRSDYFLASANYKQFAIDSGRYDPKSGRPFIWQEAYTPPKGGWSLKSEFIRNRLYMFYKTVAPSGDWPVTKKITDYPFSIKPEKKMNVRDVIALMRSTFKGTPLDTEAHPNWKKSRLATPYPSAELQKIFKVKFNRPIAVRDCSHGFVAQSRKWLPDAIGGAGWFYLDNPHTSCFAPIYAGVTRFPDSWKTYDRRKSNRKSARWAFAEMDNIVNRRYQDIIRDLRKVRTPLEADFFAKQSTIEAKALAAYKRSPSEAARILTDYSNTSMQRAERAYWDLIDTLIAKYDDK
ncbi:MAG: C69 family dipeptidase [Phycisphaerae bacterium]|jgi:dipeptidase|nr:C69 family dipeptidase [Phycisphaerae bacterium]